MGKPVVQKDGTITVNLSVCKFLLFFPSSFSLFTEPKNGPATLDFSFFDDVYVCYGLKFVLPAIIYRLSKPRWEKHERVLYRGGFCQSPGRHFKPTHFRLVSYRCIDIII